MLDIKWKSRLMGILVVLLASLGLSGLLTGFTNGQEYVGENYFDTWDFKEKVSRYAELLNVFKLDLTAESAKESIVVTKEEIEEYRYQYGEQEEQLANIRNQYRDVLQDAKDNKDTEEYEQLLSERNEKIKQINANFSSDEIVEKKIRTEEEQAIDQFFKQVQQYKHEFQSYDHVFSYYLTDIETGETYSNLNIDQKEDDPDDYFTGKEMYHVLSIPDDKEAIEDIDLSEDSILREGMERIPQFSDRSLEGRIAVSKGAPASSSLMKAYKEFGKNQKIIWAMLGVSALLFISGLYLIWTKKVWRLMNFGEPPVIYRRIPVDLRFLLLLVSVCSLPELLNLSAMGGIYRDWPLVDFFREALTRLFWLVVMLSITIIQAGWLLPLLKDSTCWKEEWQRSLSYKGKDLFLYRSIGVKVILFMGILAATGLGAAIVMYVGEELIVIYLLLFLIVTVPAILYAAINLGRFNRIALTASEAAAGRYVKDLEVKGDPALVGLAADINTLKNGMKHSRQEQVKSERMKTELITNVSHDLRTPLTSIITYTELLKKPDLNDEERNSYLDILDQKSKRLKVLIDDLFEASKMASGAIELVKERTDLVQLLQQALAEREEALKKADLQLRVSLPEQPVFVYADGQKVWRVFDNLIGNISKYALDHTRVYISLKADGGIAEISFKNIAKYELGGNTDEMLERFKRGDTSRHTEGSGLGLAIAKSIVDLHGGTLDVSADGDLFSAVVKLERM